MTINELLGNELIHRYFWFPVDGKYHDMADSYKLAYRILEAQTTQIQKGEKCLWLGNSASVEIFAQMDYGPFHPYMLKIPPQFQPRRETCEWGNEKYGHVDPEGNPCGCLVCKPTPKPETCECDCHKDVAGVGWECKCHCDIHKPKRETEPTYIDRLNGQGCGCCPCHHDTTCRWCPTCELHKPSDPVEDKIQLIVAPFIHGGEKIEKELRELVNLVRRTQ